LAIRSLVKGSKKGSGREKTKQAYDGAVFKALTGRNKRESGEGIPKRRKCRGQWLHRRADE